MLVVDRPGKSPAIDAAIALSDDAVAPDIVRPQGRQLGRRIWSATWPKLAAIGLGLAICLEVAAAHEGRLWVDSDPPHGSTFYLALPDWRLSAAEQDPTPSLR